MRKGAIVVLAAGLLANSRFQAQPPAQKQNREERPARPDAPRTMVDLNSANLADLAALPGMGPAYARRIVEGRPYVAKNQLLTQGILPRATYEQLKDHVVAHRGPAA